MGTHKAKVVSMGKQLSKGKAGRTALAIYEPEVVGLAGLQFAPYNPRVITDREMGELTASIKQFGLVMNFVVQKKSKAHGPMVVIAGHQRLKAISKICEETGNRMPDSAWAVVLDVQDPVAKKLNIALNKTGGSFDPFLLGKVLADVASLTDFDPRPLGFRHEEVDELVMQASMTPKQLAAQLEQEAETLSGFARSVTLTVEFDTVSQRDQAKELLRVLAGKKKAGAALLPLLKANSAASKKK